MVFSSVVTVCTDIINMPPTKKPDQVGDAKYRDHYIFLEAGEFFNDFAKEAHVPESIAYYDTDQYDDEPSALKPSYKHGRIFRFDDGKLLHVQFIRPRVWRIRFGAHFTKNDYTDYNT